MSDTNLTTSIQAIRTKILNDITTATVDQLLSLSRAAKSVGLTEDSDIENAVNSRVNALSSGATTEEMVKLSNAIKQVRNSSQSALSPSATSDDIVEGTTNKFMSDANLQTLGSAIIPATDATHDLGSPTNKFRDLYLDNNTLYFGTTQFTSDDILNFDLSVQPETLEIQVSADEAGHGAHWDWTWTQSALPYARTAITETPLSVVPLYMQGTYQINNFANTQYGSMTQTHSFKLKWIEGAGNDNLVSWATTTTVNHSHPDINGGNSTSVERLAVNVPSTITPPTLTAPSVTYTVGSTTGAYVFSGTAMGNNPEIGPFYRGGTYTININASGHPFYFTTDNGTNFASNTYFGEYTNGVTGSRTDSGTITFTVPAGAPDVLYYQCGVHGAMRGTIRVKDLAVETNANGNYLIYGQHTQEGHAQTIELRPIPTLTSQMCLVYDSSTNKFVPQDLSTYVENTPAFENKIKEVAGTATLIAPDGTSLVASVNIYSDATYLPAVGNTVGDIAFVEDTQKLYIYKATGWIETVANADLTGLATETFVQNYVANNSPGGGNVVEYTATSSTSVNDVVMLNSDGTVSKIDVVSYNGIPKRGEADITTTNWGGAGQYRGYGAHFHDTSDKIAALYNSSSGLKSLIVSINGSSVTTGSTYSHTGGTSARIFADQYDSSKVIILNSNGTYLTYQTGSVLGTAITWDSIVTTPITLPNPCYIHYNHNDSTDGSMVFDVAYGSLKVKRFTWDGTNMSAGNEIDLGATGLSEFLRFDPSTSGRFATRQGSALIGGLIDWTSETAAVGGTTPINGGNHTTSSAGTHMLDFNPLTGDIVVAAQNLDGFGYKFTLQSFSMDNTYTITGLGSQTTLIAGSNVKVQFARDLKFIPNSQNFVLFHSSGNSYAETYYKVYNVNGNGFTSQHSERLEQYNSLIFSTSVNHSRKGQYTVHGVRRQTGSNWTYYNEVIFGQTPYDESNLDASKVHGLAASSGTTIDVTVENGIHSGLSGLTAGSKYYVLENGTLSTTPDSKQAKIGLAMTSTSLAIDFTDELTSADLGTYATKSYVTTQVANLVDSAPATLDTLNELAAALGDDANFSTTITNSLANKLESSDLNGYATETYVGDQITAAGSYSDASVDSHLNRSVATTGQILTWNGTDYAWVDASSSISVSETAPSSPSNGDMWFDSSNANTYIYYTDVDSSQWLQIGGIGQTIQNITNNSTVFGNPTITSVSPNNFDGSSGTVITIQGTNFDVGTVVSFIDANGVETNASATSIVTQGELTATIPQAYTSAEGPLDVKVTVGDGQTITSTDAIQTGGSPTWTTAAGQLGSSLYRDQTGVSLQIEATDPDGQFVSYEIDSGSLAPGLSLAAGTGLITGDITTASITADTNYSFTANANDTSGNSTPRTFFINVLNLGQQVYYTYKVSWGGAATGGDWGHDYGRSPSGSYISGDAYVSDATIPWGGTTDPHSVWGSGSAVSVSSLYDTNWGSSGSFDIGVYVHSGTYSGRSTGTNYMDTITFTSRDISGGVHRLQSGNDAKLTNPGENYNVLQGDTVYVTVKLT
jgi:hypothetical protein